MTDGQITEFLSTVSRDESLRVRWQETASVDEAVALAKELGFSIESADLLDYMDGSVLDDADLTHAVGGSLGSVNLRAEFEGLGLPDDIWWPT
jgi:predicted ribosomally synthesized peptide with nif11-like leader